MIEDSFEKNLILCPFACIPCIEWIGILYEVEGLYVFAIIEKAVIGMALLRMLSGGIEIFAAFLMLKLNNVEKAMVVNSSLALVGPMVLIITTSIGLW